MNHAFMEQRGWQLPSVKGFRCAGVGGGGCLTCAISSSARTRGLLRRGLREPPARQEASESQRHAGYPQMLSGRLRSWPPVSSHLLPRK